jgi:hypothetical protein
MNEEKFQELMTFFNEKQSELIQISQQNTRELTSEEKKEVLHQIFQLILLLV